jgi:basic membrane protein A
MKRLLSLLGVLLVAHVALLFVRPRGATSAPVGDAVDVGIVFDVGGRGDKSFNDGAYLGAERAERQPREWISSSASASSSPTT